MSNEDFPLYMSSVEVKEEELVYLEVTYEGDINDIENAYLIGKNNNLSADIAEAKLFEKEEKIRSVFKISFPIWEDGTFQAVVKKEEKYIYEPGESHNVVFRGKGVFLDLRKIYHLTKELVVPKEKKKEKKKKKKTEKKSKEEGSTVEKTIQAEDEFNTLTLKPKNFRVFGPKLKNQLLELLDYFTNQKSLELVFDRVILPDIARSLKLCIAEEGRASVYDICFPVIVFIEKALILGGMIHKQVIDDEKYERYNKEVIGKLDEIRQLIKVTEFRNSTDLIKKEYDDDVHELKNRMRKEI